MHRGGIYNPLNKPGETQDGCKMKFAKLMMAAVVAVGTMFMVTGCGESPTQSIQNMVRAGNNGDLKTFNRYTMHEVSDQGLWLYKEATVAITVDKEEINGDTAVLDATIELTDKKSGKKVPTKGKILMKKVDGIWKAEKGSF